MLLVSCLITFCKTAVRQLLSSGLEPVMSVENVKRFELKPSGLMRSWKDLQKKLSEQHLLKISLTVLLTHCSFRHLSQEDDSVEMVFLFKPAAAAISQ